MSVRKLVSDSAFYAILPKLSVIASLLVLPIITRDLTKLDFGIHGLILAYVSIFQSIRFLGLNTIMNNVFFKHMRKYKLVWRNILAAIYLWGIAYSLLVSIVLLIATPDEAYSNIMAIVLLIVLPETIFRPVIFMGTRILFLKRKAFPLSLTQLAESLITVGGNLFTISFLKMGYMGWIYSNAFASLISFLIFGYFLFLRYEMYPIFRFSKRTFKRYLKVSLPVIPHKLGTNILGISDRILLEIFGVPIRDIGRYNLGSTFGKYVETTSIAVSMATVPHYLKEITDKKLFYKNRLKILTFMYQACLLSGTFLFCIWSKEILQFLLRNDDFSDVYLIAIVIIMGSNYRPLYNISIQYLMHSEKTSKIWIIVFGAGITNIVLNLIFIPLYGIQAAAITTFLAYLWQAMAPYWLKDYRSMNNPNNYVYQILAAILLLTLLAYWAVDKGLDEKVTLSIIALIITGTVLLLLLRKFKNYQIAQK